MLYLASIHRMNIYIEHYFKWLQKYINTVIELGLSAAHKEKHFKYIISYFKFYITPLVLVV